VELVRQVLSGLGAAHASGLLHRDIKLDNLFLCDAEGGKRTVKIIDFGLTKMTDRHAETAQRLAYPTAEDQFVGTPRYAAPEQIRGTIDERTDLYATGLVLYVLLTGREPFDDVRAHQELLAAQQNRTLDFRFSQEVSPHLERVLRRSVAKDPDERYSSAAEFLEALEAAVANRENPLGDEIELGATSIDESTRPHEENGRSGGPPVGRQFIVAVILSAVLFALLTSAVMRWVLGGG
jgi:serine/threonine protein kinase